MLKRHPGSKHLLVDRLFKPEQSGLQIRCGVLWFPCKASFQRSTFQGFPLCVNPFNQHKVDASGPLLGPSKCKYRGKYPLVVGHSCRQKCFESSSNCLRFFFLGAPTQVFLAHVALGQGLPLAHFNSPYISPFGSFKHRVLGQLKVSFLLVE